jgi:hypothetical protein
MGGCPWDGRVAPVEKLEEQRARVAESQRTTTPAKGRPAFGFVLEKTTKAEALAWSKTNSLECKDVQRGLALDCTSEPRDVFFRFDVKGMLVEVDVMHAVQPPGEAAKLTTAIAAAVTDQAGEATFEYRFSDYAADVSAMSRGEEGVVVRERYRALGVPAAGEPHAAR